MAAGEKGQQIDLGSLSAQQLSQVKKQLDDEVQHLTSSYQNLRAAQQKFRECVVSVQNGIAESVKGKLADTQHVLVDVGTGFYVEKTTGDAEKFYNNKVDELGKNIKDLENIVNGKANNLRVVEEVLRQKVLAGQQAGGSNSSAS